MSDILLIIFAFGGIGIAIYFLIKERKTSLDLRKREIELERVREDFTSMIVHELRTPLDIIKKFSEILKKPGKKTELSYQEYIGMIYQNASGMLDLVNDILDIAKLQSGKFEINLGSGDISEIIEDRIKFFEVLARDRNIKLGSLFGPNIPKVIFLDVERIKQVLNNFISNAIKFTKENGEIFIAAFVHDAHNQIESELKKLKIELPAPLPKEIFSKFPNSLVVVVKDTGVGIPPDRIGELFNKFKQLNNKELVSSVKGTGLGLVIAKGIIEEHKGHAGVVSEVGVGSAFYFVLPLLPAN
jgi:signal transduction histidine kinase